MEKFDDRLDGFSMAEYETLSQAYSVSTNKETKNGILVENVNYLNENSGKECKVFNNDNFISTIVGNEKSSVKQDFNDSDNTFVVTPTPQVTYVGLNENEIKYLNDLIQDLKQYYNDDYGLSQYLGEQEKEVERPILYFVSKNKILSKIVNLLCCIFDKSRLNKDLADLVSTLVSLSRIVNSK